MRCCPVRLSPTWCPAWSSYLVKPASWKQSGVVIRHFLRTWGWGASLRLRLSNHQGRKTISVQKTNGQPLPETLIPERIRTKHKMANSIRGRAERMSSQRQPRVGITNTARRTSKTVPMAQKTCPWKRGKNRKGYSNGWVPSQQGRLMASAFDGHHWWKICSAWLAHMAHSQPMWQLWSHKQWNGTVMDPEITTPQLFILDFSVIWNLTSLHSPQSAICTSLWISWGGILRITLPWKE